MYCPIATCGSAATDPQQSHPPEGPRVLQGVSSCRSAATARATGRDTARGTRTHLRPRPTTLHEVRRGDASPHLRVESPVPHRCPLQREPQGTVNPRDQRRCTSGQRPAAQLTPSSCLQKHSRGGITPATVTEAIRRPRARSTTARAIRSGPSPTQTLHRDQHRLSSNTPSRKSRG